MAMGVTTGRVKRTVVNPKPTRATTTRESTPDVREKEKVDGRIPLDLFSTSPTYSEDCAVFCTYHAPYFAFHKHDKTYGVVQGCCNHWDCPRCGIQRAKHEYGRIVEGCKKLSERYQLWFITITCRGKEMTAQEADENYGYWTNRLLDMWRLQSKRTHQTWAYVQVTERQKRGIRIRISLRHFAPLIFMRERLKNGKQRMMVGEPKWLYRPIALNTSTIALFGLAWARNMTFHKLKRLPQLVDTWRNISLRTRYFSRHGLKVGSAFVTPNPFLPFQSEQPTHLSCCRFPIGINSGKWQVYLSLTTTLSGRSVPLTVDALQLK